MNCPFCETTNSNVLFKSNSCLILIPQNIIKQGHLIITSVRHVESVANLNIEESVDMMKNIRKTVKAIDKHLHNHKTYILSIGDIVAHVHFHLIPKKITDPSIGDFIFGSDGWRGGLSYTVDNFSNENIYLGIRSEFYSEQ